MNTPTTHWPEFIRIPANRARKTLTFIIAFLILIFPNSTLSQSSFSSTIDEHYPKSSDDSKFKFEPSLAVAVGALSIAFSLTFLTLIYVKCCRISLSSSNHESFGGLPRSRSRFSGIDKAVIESLPFFKFSSLKGSKNGLECSVCLSSFEDVEVLRLLPKCKHAFHIDCIDQWLEKHSSCPLCRLKVVKEDIIIKHFSSTFSNSLRLSEPSNLSLFIEREGSSRFGTKIENINDHDVDDQEILLHKFHHRIMVCNDDHDPLLKTKWSNVTPSDLLFFRSEMITCVSSNRFDRRETERELATECGGGRRSVSEITVHPRFLEGEVRVEEERFKRLWLPIARKTVERFGNNSEISNSVSDGQRLQIDVKSKELLDV